MPAPCAPALLGAPSLASRLAPVQAGVSPWVGELAVFEQCRSAGFAGRVVARLTGALPDQGGKGRPSLCLP